MGFHNQRLRSITSKGQLTPVFSSLKALWSLTQPPGNFVFSLFSLLFFFSATAMCAPTKLYINQSLLFCVPLKLILIGTNTTVVYLLPIPVWLIIIKSLFKSKYGKTIFIFYFIIIFMMITCTLCKSSIALSMVKRL